MANRLSKLLIARTLDAGAEPFQGRATLLPLPRVSFSTHRASARGLYRIFNTAGFRFFWSNSGAPVAGTTPQATNATLPYQPSATFADGTWYLSVSYFDGVLDSGFLPIGPQGQTYLVLVISGGAALGTPPSGPTNPRLQVRAGGVVRVLASYIPAADGVNAADHWGIAYTTNGSTPPSGSATIKPAITTGSGALKLLAYDLPAQTNGTVVKVQLQMIRGTTYSLPGTVLSATADATGPSAPLALQSWFGPLPESL